MTMKGRRHIMCPKCNREQDVFIHQTINVTLDPDLRDQFFKGEINTFDCVSCGEHITLTVPLLYHDMRKRLCVMYDPTRVTKPASAIEGKTSDEKPDSESLDGDSWNYLENPHTVSDIDEMIRYIMLREHKYENREQEKKAD